MLIPIRFGQMRMRHTQDAHGRSVMAEGGSFRCQEDAVRRARALARQYDKKARLVDRVMQELD